MKYLLALFLVTASTLSPAIADTALTEESQQILEQLRKEIRQTLKKIAIEESKLGNDISDLHLEFSGKANLPRQFGMILSTTKDDSGYIILGVTPNSYAEKLGVKVSEFLLSYNEMPATTENFITISEALENLSADDDLHLMIKGITGNRSIKQKIPGSEPLNYSFTLDGEASSLKQ